MKNKFNFAEEIANSPYLSHVMKRDGYHKVVKLLNNKQNLFKRFIALLGKLFKRRGARHAQPTAENANS